MTVLPLDSTALLDLSPFVAIHGAHELAAAVVDPCREEDDSRTVPADVEVFDLGAGLGRAHCPYRLKEN